MVIGRGTYGKVFLATHKKTQKKYAVKSMRKDKLMDDEVVDSVQLEQ